MNQLKIQKSMQSTKYRIYLNQQLSINSEIELIDKTQINKINRVLRLKKADYLRVFNGDGTEYLIQIKSINNHRIILSPIEKQYFSKQKTKITLAFWKKW